MADLVAAKHLCGGEGCYFCEWSNPTLFDMTDKDKFDEAAKRVNRFLHANYPCGCDTEDECDHEENEAATIVRMVLEVYKGGTGV